jgi:hypothetical protein
MSDQEKAHQPNLDGEPSTLKSGAPTVTVSTGSSMPTLPILGDFRFNAN